MEATKASDTQTVLKVKTPTGQLIEVEVSGTSLIHSKILHTFMLYSARTIHNQFIINRSR
jgi:hypothetical protein